MKVMASNVRLIASSNFVDHQIFQFFIRRIGKLLTLNERGSCVIDGIRKCLQCAASKLELVLVTTCLRGRIGINCPSAFQIF